MDGKGRRHDASADTAENEEGKGKERDQGAGVFRQPDSAHWIRRTGFEGMLRIQWAVPVSSRVCSGWEMFVGALIEEIAVR